MCQHVACNNLDLNPLHSLPTGAMLCGLGFISAIIVSTLDRWGMKQLGQDDSIKVESKKMVRVEINNITRVGRDWKCYRPNSVPKCMT
jgi:hypothetical protein